MINETRVPGCLGAGLVAFAAATPRFVHSRSVSRLNRCAETTANVSIGDLNGDGHIGYRARQSRTLPLKTWCCFLGTGKGYFKRRDRPLRMLPIDSYSAHLGGPGQTRRSGHV